MQNTWKLVLAAAAFGATMTVAAPASYAYGDAPWCAVVEIGAGEVYWDCQYQTFEACRPNVIAGNRGFCNINPTGPGPQPPAAATPRRHKHTVQHPVQH